LFDWVELYINAPAAVNDAPAQDTGSKLTYAVVPPDEPEVGDVEIVSVRPPAVYPVPVISPVVLYAAVLAPRAAVPSYKAILKVLGEVGPKL
jgi:hypothetical protein